MRCFGITQTFKRCKKNCDFIFCKTHRFQWWSIIVALGVLGGIFQDVIKPIFASTKDENYKGITRIEYADWSFNREQRISSMNQSYMDVFWQDRIYREHDFDVYPSNEFAINGNNSKIEAINLHIKKFYSTSIDHYFTVDGKGDGGTERVIFDANIDIKKDKYKYSIFSMGNNQNPTKYILTEKVATEITLRSNKFYEFRLIFNNASNDSLYAFDYFLEIKWTYYDWKDKLRKTISTKSQTYTYSFAPMYMFSKLYKSIQPDTAYYYMHEGLNNSLTGSGIFLEFASPPNTSSNVDMEDNKSNINFINLREKDLKFNHKNINSELLNKTFILFDNEYLFVIDPDDKKNKGFSGRGYIEKYVTKTIKGEQNVLNELYKNTAGNNAY